MARKMILIDAVREVGLTMVIVLCLNCVPMPAIFLSMVAQIILLN